MSEFGDVRLRSLDSSGMVPDFCQIGRNLARTAGIMDGSDQDLARMVGSKAIYPKSSQNGKILARTAGFQPIGQDPTILGQILVIFTGIRHKWLDSCHFCRNPYAPNFLKNIFILFYINIFYVVNKI
jgi:hypothetical protein